MFKAALMTFVSKARRKLGKHSNSQQNQRLKRFQSNARNKRKKKKL
jgi:hypothetical protein